MSEPTNFIEDAALKNCAKLLNSALVRDLNELVGPEIARTIVILAFTYGAAWGMDGDESKMLKIADAQIDSLRALKS